MTHALVLVLYVVAGGGEDCHLVTNHRILALPSCDLTPGMVAQLTENRVVSSNAMSVRPGSFARRGYAQAARPVPVTLSPVELQARLEIAEEERVGAVSQRLIAERERDDARRARDAATRELNTVRRELAALRAIIDRRDRSVRAESPRSVSAGRLRRRPQ
jgi:hypothetical protein